MLRKSILVILCTLLLGPAWSALGAFDPTLAVYWPLDEGTGTVANDLSGHNINGTISAGPVWVTPGKIGVGALRFTGTGDVRGAHVAMDQRSFTIAFWVNPTLSTSGSQIVFSEQVSGANSVSMHLRLGGPASTDSPTNGIRFGFYNDDLNTANNVIQSGNWYHLAFWYDWASKARRIYINGVQVAADTSATGFLATSGVICLGSWTGGSNYTGLADDLQIYQKALSDAEIKNIMGGLVNKNLATVVSPGDAATDVPRDATLNWNAGQYPATHDVYFGTVAADVNSASRTTAKGVLASQGQADTTFDPAGSLAYGQTYYWRIDEVNKSPDGTVYKGGVWSFTAEPYGYPITKVTATASSSQTSMGPEKTIDGSGLDKADLHGNDPMTMWMSKGTLPNWIQYEFDAVYKLDRLLVWNSNQMIESYIGFGAKDVTVEYSVDGTTWTALANVPPFAQATALPAYAANTTVNFGGIMAKHVKLTINKTWGGLPTTGLAEVRFSYVPVQARAPQPATAATGQGVSTTLNWRPGREAGSHKVFFGTDPNAVANGTATAKTVTDHAFDPGALIYGTKYYWKVDEVNTVTYPGSVWSFTTKEFAAVDDFESYNDKDNTIFDTWIDGVADGKSGSQVGYNNAPFAEQTIIHGGKQSMPMAYDNSKSPFYSEATRDLGTAQDWTGNGATHMDLWFRGYPAPVSVAVTETGGKMTLTGSGTDIWNNSDDFTFAYKTLTGDGSLTARVVSVGTGTNTWAKGGVMIRASLAGGSIFADTVITGGGGNGASFQQRLTTNGGCGNADSAAPAKTAPYWVRIERKGSTVTGYLSADGKTWAQQGTPQALTMIDPVLIGICVTSHQAGEQRTMQFDSIATTGGVTGAWQGAAVNSPQYNAPAGLYVVVQDNAGKSKLVAHPDPAAVATGAWTQWKIPLSDLTAAGVKTTKIQKVTVGAGDKTSPKAGGLGMLYIDDIGFGHPAQ